MLTTTVRRNVVTGNHAFRPHLRGVYCQSAAWVHDGGIALLAAAKGVLPGEGSLFYPSMHRTRSCTRQAILSSQNKFNTTDSGFVSLVEHDAGRWRPKLLRMESSNCVQTSKLK